MGSHGPCQGTLRPHKALHPPGWSNHRGHRPGVGGRTLRMFNLDFERLISLVGPQEIPSKPVRLLG